MTISNGYITRTNLLNWLASATATSSADDLVIDDIIEQTSRIIDDITARRFYPFRQTRKYDLPEDNELDLVDDLLEVYTLTNGDASVIASSDYNLYSVNDPPYWSIRLKDISTVSWQTTAGGSSEQVVTLDGLWSYRPQYTAQGWTQIGTLGAAMADTTTLTVTLVAGHTASTGQIWKVDTEIFQGSVSTNTITAIQRGDNGTTAATHLNGVAVYAWNVYKPIQSAAYQIAVGVYKRRFGEGVTGVARVTGAGVVITPQDVPQLAMKTLISLSRLS